MTSKYCPYCKIYYLGDQCASCSTKPKQGKDDFYGMQMPDFVEDLFGSFGSKQTSNED